LFRTAVAVVVALAVTLISGDAAAVEIREIVIADNSKTTDDTVRFIAGIDEGDDWTEPMQDEIRIHLVSSGLFKDVSVFSEPHPKGGIKVTIIAKDKHSWVIAPTVYNQPTNKGAGIGFGENNLFGENKKLLLYGQVATGDSFFIGAYVDPSINGTPFHWQFDLFLQNERVFEYASPTALTEAPDQVRESKLRYFNAGVKAGVTLFRSLSLDGRLRGAYVFYNDVPRLVDDATEEDLGLMPGEPIPAPGAEGWDFSGEVVLAWDRRANWYGITSGDKYQLTYERSLGALGSDFDYRYYTAGVVFARKFLERHNLIFKATGEYGENLPFQHEFTAGGTTLRGYKNAQFRGDFKLASNFEYSVPVFTIKGFSLRALGFTDVAYIAFRNTEQNEMDGVRHYLPDHDFRGKVRTRTSVGVGTRVYLRQIVLPLLGLDLGYSLESGGFELYFAIGLTDF
jgi:outer membrane protein assembly factor BamA